MGRMPLTSRTNSQLNCTPIPIASKGQYWDAVRLRVAEIVKDHTQIACKQDGSHDTMVAACAAGGGQRGGRATKILA